MSQKPTLIFVPGAWHTASTWDKVTSILESQQFKCISVTLPSTQSNPTATFKDDLDVVRNAISTETTQGYDVVVIEHSYGGQVGNSAVKDFTKPKDGSSTGSGHVIGIAMIASGSTPTGTSFLEGFGGIPPPLWTINEETGFADIVMDPREAFYHDLPEDEAKEWIAKLGEQSLKAMREGGEYNHAGWLDVPFWFLVCMDDRCYPPAMQQYFVQAAMDLGADATMREVKSSHSPMLSMPKETSEYILEAVKAFTG